ncbi:MAG: hypothetical protein V4510_00695 [bacterium]
MFEAGLDELVQPDEVQEIVQRLRLKASASDEEGVKRELRLRLAELHPDHAGQNGRFADEFDKEEFLQVKSALAALEKRADAGTGVPESRALVPFDQVRSLMEVALRSQASSPAAESVRRREFLDNARGTFRRAAAPPKMTSGGIAVAIGALWTFSGQLKDSVFGRWIPLNSPLVAAATAAVFFVCAVIFLLVRHFEKRQAAWAEFMMSEAGLFRLLDADARTFTRRELMERIHDDFYRGRRAGYGFGRRLTRLFGHRLSPALLDDIVEIQLDRLRSRDAILALPGSPLNPRYELKQSPDPLD